ncbi:hypothetical protein BH09BAC1_BH09BAC1_10290 [soil metagenome]
MKFITYFDYLGFGEFIKNNSQSEQKRILNNIFRDMEVALARDKLKKSPHGYVADFSETRVHCINFSDTIIYWTNDTSIESLEELIEVTSIFNWKTNLHLFPARGAIVMGEMDRIMYSSQSEVGGTYTLNSVFGKGLVLAHEVAEQQYWAGTVLHNSVVDFINETIEFPAQFMDKYTKLYNVPIKDGTTKATRAFNLIKGDLNNEAAFNNISNGIREVWSYHNKSIEHPSVLAKLENTLSFLESYRN